MTSDCYLHLVSSDRKRKATHSYSLTRDEGARSHLRDSLFRGLYHFPKTRSASGGLGPGFGRPCPRPSRQGLRGTRSTSGPFTHLAAASAPSPTPGSGRCQKRGTWTCGRRTGSDLPTGNTWRLPTPAARAAAAAGSPPAAGLGEGTAEPPPVARVRAGAQGAAEGRGPDGGAAVAGTRGGAIGSPALGGAWL